MSATKIIALISMVLLCLSPACGVNQKRNGRDGQSISESTNQQRQEYEKKAQQELNRLDEQIARLKAEAAKKGGKTRGEINQEIRDLNHRSDLARQKLGQLEHSSQKAWKDMKVGMDAAMKDLETSYEHAASNFK